MPENAEAKPHIAILGAGPTGLEAALAAAEDGYPFTLYEASSRVAGHIREWSHVQLFTPWELNVSPRMARTLSDAGRPVPTEAAYPTGGELVERILDPVAELPQIRGSLRLGVTVRQIGRRGLLKHEEIGSGKRAACPFRLLVSDAAGNQSVDEADIVLDCTGHTVPNPVGDGGIPAPGEETLDGQVARHIPDLAREATDWAGSKVLLVGAGHSAQTALCELCEHAPDTEIVWAVRSESPTWGLVDDDPLPERHRLSSAAAALAENPPPNLDVRRGVAVEAFDQRDGRIRVTLRRADGTTESVDVDRILALTGKVGDHRLYRQLQVHECYATVGPMKLAAALMAAGGGASGGDCLQQSSQGPETLQNPEPGFFILGSKSYGRRNDFLMRVGWEQVGEVFELLGR